MLMKSLNVKKEKRQENNKVNMKKENMISHLSTRMKIRKERIRRKLRGTNERPRVSVFRSNSELYVQAINDDLAQTLASVSTMEKAYKGKAVNVNLSKEIGKVLGERILQKGLKLVVFDRNGRRYHGRIKAFAEGLREAGLQF